MTARRERTRLRAVTGKGQYAVLCRRFDGRWRIWQRYADREEAERVAAHLSEIGCPSRCASDDDLALEGGAP